jgi:hypothetical protein
MTDESRSDNQQSYPAVDVAYEFVLPSYQMLAARFEAADNRLTTVPNFAATVTLGVPILAKAIQPEMSFGSPLFVAAVLAFIAGAVLAIMGRLRGGLVLPDPAVLYEQRLDESEWEFRKNAIFFAGQHFERNSETIRRKNNVAYAVAAMFFLEIVWLVLWMVVNL